MNQRFDIPAELFGPEKFQAALIRQFAARQNTGGMTALVVAVTVALILWDHIPTGLMIGWVAAQIILNLLAMARWNYIRRTDHIGPTAYALVIEAVIWKAVSGVLWGALAIYSNLYLPPSLQFFTVITVAAMTIGAVSILAAIPLAAYSFIILSLVPFIALWLASAAGTNIALGLLAILLLVVILNSARIAGSQILSVLQAEADHQRLSDEFMAARGQWLELSDASEAYVLFDRDDRLLAWNDRFAELLKVSDELLFRGATRSDLIRSARQSIDVANGALPMEQWVRKRIEASDPASDEAQIHNYQDGLWLQRRLRRTQSGNLVVSFVDWTDLAKMETALHESENRYRTILDSMRDTYYRTDMDGRVVMLSRSAVNLVGYSMEELLGCELADMYVEPNSREKFLQELEKSGGDIQGYEAALRHKDGHAVWVSTNAQYHRDTDGNIIGIEGTTRDISEQKQHEEQLRQAQKMQAVGQLTGGVAHDFNNLLSITLGNAEILKGQLGDGEGANRVEAIIRAARRGGELTHRLLSFSRQQTLSPREIDANSLIAGMTGMLGRTLGETIEIITNDTGDLWRVQADPGQLENALINLAINARDAMPKGGTLVLDAANVRRDAENTMGDLDVVPGDYVELSVTDTGTGIPPEVREHVFEPFFTTKEVGEGSGLGLSMVYGFAAQSGGCVEIESQMGKGTTVRIYLPRAMDTDMDATTLDKKDVTFPLTGATVLVVEDDPDVREIAVGILSQLGCNIIEAEDGETALTRLDEHADIDVLFSDVVLPGGMSGPDIAEAARAKIPGIKVILASGYPDGGINRPADNPEQPWFICKPYHKSDLAELLEKAMQS